MKGRAIHYTAEQYVWLWEHGGQSAATLHAAFTAAFPGTAITLQNLVAKRKRMGLRAGGDGRFQKGQTPPNKGRKGWHAPGCEKGWFKPGHRGGRALDVYKPIGTIREAKGGYLQIKVNEDMPLQRRWRGLHIVNWERAHGPLPAGMALKCLNGDRKDCRAENWEALPRAVLARLNEGRHRKQLSYDAAPAELKPTVMALAKLKHAASVRART